MHMWCVLQLVLAAGAGIIQIHFCGGWLTFVVSCTRWELVPQASRPGMRYCARAEGAAGLTCLSVSGLAAVVVYVIHLYPQHH